MYCAIPSLEFGRIIASSHPDWTGYSPELLELACQSDAGSRLVMKALSLSVSALPADIRAELTGIKEQYSSAASGNDDLWQIVDIMPDHKVRELLLVLAALSGVHAVRRQIQQQQVRLWCDLLGEANYVWLVQKAPANITDLFAPDFIRKIAFLSENAADSILLEVLGKSWWPSDPALPDLLFRFGTTLFCDLLAVREKQRIIPAHIELRFRLLHSPRQKDFFWRWRSWFTSPGKAELLSDFRDQLMLSVRHWVFNQIGDANQNGGGNRE